VSDSASLDVAAVVSANRTTRNAASNYIYYGFQALVLLVLQAYVIRSLGGEHYSVWPLLRSCINVAALVQIGVGAGASRFFAVAIGQRDEQRVQKLLGTYLFATLVGASVYFLIAAIIAANLELLFNIPDGYASEARCALLVMGISGAMQMGAAVLEATLTATQSFVKLNCLRGGMLVIRASVVFCSFSVFGPDLVWVAVSHLVVSVAEMVGCVLLLKSVLPWLKVTISGASWGTFREVTAFSLLALVMAIAGQLYWDTDYFLINRLIDPVLVTGYSIVATVLLRCTTLTSLGNNAVATPLAVLFGRNDIKGIAGAVYRANRAAVPLGGFAMFFLMFFGDDFIALYAGEEYRSYSYLFILFGFGFVISTTQNLPARIPVVFGEIGIPAAMTVAAALTNLVLSSILVCIFDWGLTGVAVGTLAMQVAYRATFYPWFVANLLREPVLRFYYRTILIPVGNCVPAIVCMAAMRLLSTQNTVSGLLLVVVISGMVHAVFLVSIGLDRRDRTKVQGVLAQAAGRARAAIAA
jgi:O-antigen/teichoic acid export membrane protein